MATGPGYIAGRAADRGAEVVGVDLSAEIIALARTLNSGVPFRVADALDLPFEDAAFDVVVAGFLVPHLADHARALTEFCRILAPGGVVALSTWALPERVPMLGLVVDAVAEAGALMPAELPPGPSFFRFSEKGALASLLQAAGLADVDVTTHGLTHHVPSADALWDGVLSGSVRTSALITNQNREVRQAIRAAFDRLVAPYELDGRLELPTSILICHGRLPASRTMDR